MLCTCGFLQFDDAFVQQHYPQFESAADLRQSLISSTMLARVKDLEEQTQDAIVTQVRASITLCALQQ